MRTLVDLLSQHRERHAFSSIDLTVEHAYECTPPLQSILSENREPQSAISKNTCGSVRFDS